MFFFIPFDRLGFVLVFFTKSASTFQLCHALSPEVEGTTSTTERSLHSTNNSSTTKNFQSIYHLQNHTSILSDKTIITVKSETTITATMLKVVLVSGWGTLHRAITLLYNAPTKVAIMDSYVIRTYRDCTIFIDINTQLVTVDQLFVVGENQVQSISIFMSCLIDHLE